MIPEIEFVYSQIYDFKWPVPKEKFKIKFIDNYLKSIEKIWKKNGKTILKEISELSGLKWKEKKIKVYFLSGGRTFSDPLTVTYKKDKNKFIDDLTHELIHHIQIQNLDTCLKYVKHVISNYSEEPRNTRSHIFLHAIHYQILKKVFGKRRLNKNIKWHDQFEDYKRAWEIVLKETPDKIIKDFRKVTK